MRGQINVLRPRGGWWGDRFRRMPIQDAPLAVLHAVSGCVLLLLGLSYGGWLLIGPGGWLSLESLFGRYWTMGVRARLEMQAMELRAAVAKRSLQGGGMLDAKVGEGVTGVVPEALDGSRRSRVRAAENFGSNSRDNGGTTQNGDGGIT